MLPSPIFFRPAQWTFDLNTYAHEAKPLNEWCDIAGIPCKASGEWIKRAISWFPMKTDDHEILAEPGFCDAVRFGVPAYVVRHGDVEIARWILQAMAYSQLFDGVARESVKGVAWARHISNKGRPRLAAPKTGAQRQKRFRDNKKAIQPPDQKKS